MPATMPANMPTTSEPCSSYLLLSKYQRSALPTKPLVEKHAIETCADHTFGLPSARCAQMSALSAVRSIWQPS